MGSSHARFRLRFDRNLKALSDHGVSECVVIENNDYIGGRFGQWLPSNADGIQKMGNRI